MFPVEIFQSTITKFSKILDSLEMRFHLTGGVTGTAYGEPRMTQDIDVVEQWRTLSEKAGVPHVIGMDEFFPDKATPENPRT